MSAKPSAVFLVAVGLFITAGCVAPKPTEPNPSPTPPALEPYRAFLDPSGNATDTPVNYIANPTRGPANELSIAVNPKDPNNLVAGSKDYYLGKAKPCVTTPSNTKGYDINVWSGVYWSRDGGRTWSDALMAGHPGDDANATNPQRAWTCNSDPVVVFGEDGTAYYSGLGIWGDNVPKPDHPCVETGRSIWLMKSTDGGATWKDFSCVAGSTYDPATRGVLLDKQWFDVVGRNVYFSYISFKPIPAPVSHPFEADLKFRRSTDGGATWGPELTLFEYPTTDHPDAIDGGRQYTMPQVGPDGMIHLIWHSFGSDNGIYYTRSTDQGATFQTPRRIQAVDDIQAPFAAGLYRAGSLPSLGVDDSRGNHSGNLYIAWSDNANGDPDIFFIRSTDDGATWEAPQRLNLDATGNGKHQFLPWLAVGPDASVHVAWLDDRAHPNATRLDVYLRSSFDGGKTWQPEFKVNAHTIETEKCHHQNTRNFIGDYLGLAASSQGVHPLWPDGRLGKCNAMTATILARP